MLLLSAPCLADSTVYIGRNSGGEVVAKEVVANSSNLLEDFRLKSPSLTWSIGSDLDIVKKIPSLKDQYRDAKTVEERLSLIEDMLQIK